jgi:pyridoxamine 5'-phosphate oxidase
VGASPGLGGGQRDPDRIRDRRVQYETTGLDIGDVDPDPMRQWHRWHDDAFEAGVVEPNAMTLSTVDADGRPDARIVLVRGADERGFTFFTNYESTKAIQLAGNPAAAVTFGWLDLHRQVRVRARVEPVADHESDAYFASRPRGSQIGAWGSPQSSTLADRDELDRRVARFAADFHGREIRRPQYWGGYRVVPEQWEFWQGRPNRLHDRLQYSRVGDDWTVRRLAP